MKTKLTNHYRGVGRIVAMLLLCYGLLACSTTAPPISKPVNWQQHRHTLQGMVAWRIFAKVAINHERKSWYLRWDWQQQDDHYQMRFLSPFGNILGDLQTDSGQHVVLKVSDGHRYVAESPEALLSRYLNLAVPISQVKTWIKGMPSQSQHEATFNEYGLLEHLSEEGWTVTFKRYDYVDDVLLPHYINCRRDGWEIKIAIKRWTLGNKLK